MFNGIWYLHIKVDTLDKTCSKQREVQGFDHERRTRRLDRQTSFESCGDHHTRSAIIRFQKCRQQVLRIVCEALLDFRQKVLGRLFGWTWDKDKY